MFRTVAIVVVVIAPMHAAAAGSCMTESEARHAFPTSHLYWHGADHCWDATPGGRRYTKWHPHPFAGHQVVQAEPQPVIQAELQPAIQAQSQPAEEPAPSPTLTPDDLARAGHTMMIEKLESKLKERWSDTHMELQTKSPLLASATADAQPTVAVGIVVMSIGGVLVICATLVAFGASIEPRRHARRM